MTIATWQKLVLGRSPREEGRRRLQLKLSAPEGRAEASRKRRAYLARLKDTEVGRARLAKWAKKAKETKGNRKKKREPQIRVRKRPAGRPGPASR